MFPGPAQRKQIDKIGHIFSGFLSTCFLGPNPSNIWMFEKWKQHCCQVFFACLFLVRSPQNKPKQLYYVAQFPMTSPPKKNYIYILYINYIILYYIILYYIISYYIMYIYIILYYVTYIYIYIYIYICSIFLPQIFPRPAVQKNKHICSIFPQPALPSQPKKKQTYILFIFLSPICPRPALQKI